MAEQTPNGGYDPDQDTLSPTGMVHRYLQQQGVPLNAVNVRRALEGAARGQIPGLSGMATMDPPTAAPNVMPAPAVPRPQGRAAAAPLQLPQSGGATGMEGSPELGGRPQPTPGAPAMAAAPDMSGIAAAILGGGGALLGGGYAASRFFGNRGPTLDIAPGGGTRSPDAPFMPETPAQIAADSPRLGGYRLQDDGSGRLRLTDDANRIPLTDESVIYMGDHSSNTNALPDHSGRPSGSAQTAIETSQGNPALPKGGDTGPSEPPTTKPRVRARARGVRVTPVL